MEGKAGEREWLKLSETEGKENNIHDEVSVPSADENR